GPGAAEGAVPRAAARELDRSRRVEDADEVFFPVTEQIARRLKVVEAMDERRRRSFSVGGHDAGSLGDSVAVALERLEEGDDPGLALALHHAVDRARAVLDE